MALIDGGQLDPIRRSNEEREILHGRKSALSYSPLEGAVERSPVTEQISHGETGSIPYQPLERSNFSLPPLGGAGGAGSETEPNVDWSKIAPAGAIGTSTRWPGDRGTGGVLQMSLLEIGSGLAAAVEALSGGRLGADTRRALDSQVADVFQSLRPDVQADLHREFTDLGPEGVLRNPSALGYQVLKQVPILATLLVPGVGGGAVGGRVAVGAATRRGASELGVQAARRKGITAGATVGGAAGESTVVGGMTAGQIMSGIENASDEILMGSPAYRQMREQGADEATAKRQLMNELGRREGLNVGAGSVVLNLIPAHVLGRILSGATRGKRALGEALVTQPVTEMMQEPFEGYREDVAAQESYDPSRVPGADTLERAVAGGVLGLATGGGLAAGGYVGRRMLGIDVIDTNDTTNQQLGDPAIAEAIPTTPPPAQGEFDFGGTGGPAAPNPADVGPPGPGSFPESPPGQYTTRRGDQRPMPPPVALTDEQRAADENLDRVEPAVRSRSRFVGPEGARREFMPGDMQFGTEANEARAAAEARKVAADEAAARSPDAARLEQLEYELDRSGLIDPLTGEPTKKADAQTKEEKARLAELKKLRAADPDTAGQARMDRLERRAEENWFDEVGKPRKGLKGPALKAAKELAALRVKYAPQTEMNLPPGSPTDPVRRKLMKDAEQKALPAPPPSEQDAGAALQADETGMLRSQITLLEEQPSLNESEKARLTSLRRQLTKLSRTPEALAAQARQRGQERRQRAGGTTVESGPAIAVEPERAPIAPLAERGQRTPQQSGRGVTENRDGRALRTRIVALERSIFDRERVTEPLPEAEAKQLQQDKAELGRLQEQLDQMGRAKPSPGFLKAQDAQATRTRLNKLTKRLNGLENLSKKRPLSKREQQQFERGKTELAQLQGELDQMAAGPDVSQLQANVRDAQATFDTALEEAKRLAATPTQTTQAGKPNKAAQDRLEKARKRANKTLEQARSRLKEVQTQLAAETDRATEPTARPRDDTTGDLFGERTSEDDIRDDWREPFVPVEKAKTLLRDAVRTSLLQMVGTPYSRGVTRAANRLQAKLIVAMKGKKTSGQLLEALRKVAVNEANAPFGDAGFDVTDVLDRAHRLLTGRSMPKSAGGNVINVTAEEFAALAAEAPRQTGRTEATVEGADVSETEFDPRGEALTEALTTAEEAAEQAQLEIEELQAEPETDEVTAEIAELMAKQEEAQQAAEEEVSELGRLTEETSDELDMSDDVDMAPKPTEIVAPGEKAEEALAKFQASEELNDPYTASLPETDSGNPLQRVVDLLGRNEVRGMLRQLVDLFGKRATSRMLRQVLATFGPKGIFRQNAQARQVLDRWRGDVMLFALQEGDPQLQTAMSLLSDRATADLQTVWLLRGLNQLAESYPDLQISVKELLGGRDTDLLRGLGELSIKLQRATDTRVLGKQITELTTLTDEELLAMPRDELRKLVNSRLGIPMPRKGVREKGYTMEAMVEQLREYERMMRSAYETFVVTRPDIDFTHGQWTTMVSEGLGTTQLTNEQLAVAVEAFQKGLEGDVTISGRVYKAGLEAAAANLRQAMTTQLLPTSAKRIAKADNITQREAQVQATANARMVNRMMNRVSERFRKEVASRIKDAETQGVLVYQSPERVADSVAGAIEQERALEVQSARQAGAAKGRMTRSRAKQQEMLIEAYDPDIKQTQENLPASWTLDQIRQMYRRHNLPVPGEPRLPAEIEGSAELAAAREAEARRFYGNEFPLEHRVENLPVNWYNRLNNPDAAHTYVLEQLRRIVDASPEASSADIQKRLGMVLEIPAASAKENTKTGRLTDAQFLQLLEGLGFSTAHPDPKLGKNFDRAFAVSRILNSTHAFRVGGVGQPIFTGGQFLTNYVRPMFLNGEPQIVVANSLQLAHHNTVAAIARYLNDNNDIGGNKSQLTEFIMNSDRVQALWAEAQVERRIMEQQVARERPADGPVRNPMTGRFARNFDPLPEDSPKPVKEMTKEERKVAEARIDGLIAEYDRLLDQYHNDPQAMQQLLQEQSAARELLGLLLSDNPDAKLRASLEKSHAESMAYIRGRIGEMQGRVKALQQEIAKSRKRDTDYQRGVMQLASLDPADLKSARTRLATLVRDQRTVHKQAVRAKRMQEAKQAAQLQGQATDLIQTIDAHLKNGLSEVTARKLRKHLAPASAAVAPDSVTAILESTLAEYQRHTRYLQEQLVLEFETYKKAAASTQALSVYGWYQKLVDAEATSSRVAANIEQDRLRSEQLADDTGNIDTLNQAETDKRREALREQRAQVWPRADSSLQSLIEWAKTAEEAYRKFVNDIKIGTRTGADRAGMVTTSAMETITPYSNELVVGGRPVEALFVSTNAKGMAIGVRNDRMPTYLRGPVKLLTMTAKVSKVRNTKITHDGKTYKLAEMKRSEIATLRNKLAKQFAKTGHGTVVKKLDALRSYMELDSQMRLAYLQAYALLGDIHMTRRVQYPDGQKVFMKRALRDLDAAKTDIVTSRAEPSTMTDQQKRAAREQEREAAHTATEAHRGVVEGWTDQSPEAELARLDKAIKAGELLQGYVNMGRQIHRQRQLREFTEQDAAQALAAVQERKKHMDLPAEQAGDFIAGSAFVSDALTAARSRPVGTREVLKALVESGSIDDMPAVSRFMILTAHKFGLDIPVRWVSSEPVDGKAFLGRFVFDPNNPAKGREILINRRVYDALINKERANDPELGHWNTHGRLAHAFMHELAHAMTHLKLLTDPNLQREFGTLLGIARQVMGRDHYGLTDVFEFAAEYFSNEAFQRDLHTVRINQDGTPISLWQRITNVVRAIFMMPPQTTSMFEYMMDRSSALFMSPQMVQQFAETGMPHQLSQGYLNYEITMDTAGAAMANAAELAAEQASRWRWSLAAESGVRKVKLGFMTLDQIGESYAGLASKYTDLQNKKWAEVNRDMDSATRMMQDFSALDGDVAMRLSTVMLKATNFAIHPDQPRGPSSMNAHLSNSPEMAKIYNELKAEYDALPSEAKAVYAAVRQRHAEDYAKTTRFVTTNIMAAFDFDVDNLPANWYEKLQEADSPTARHEYLSNLWDTHGLPDPKTGKKSERGFTEEEADSLARLARRPKLVNGPYFPMKRFGKYVVRARANMKFDFASEAEMGQVLGSIKDREPGARFEGFENDSLSGTVSFQLTEMYDRLDLAHKRNAELFNESVMDMTGKAFEFKGRTLTWSEIPGVAEKNQMAMHELSGHYSSSFLARMQDKLKKQPAALAAAKEAYLQMLPDTSMRKLELKRGHVQGADKDMIRSFAAVTKAAAYGNAQVKYGRLLSNEMQDMQKRSKNDYAQQAVVQELQKRDMNTANFMQEGLLGTTMDRLTEGGFVWFLGSPSYWMVNATQPYLLTLPYLSARYGTGASYAALARARKMVFPTLAGKAARSGFGLKALRRDPKAHREFMRDIFGGLDDLFQGVKDPSMRAMLQEVEQMGLIDLTIAKDLNQTIKGAGPKGWEAIVDMTRVMPHLVEVLNRSMTALAAYDLATRKGMGYEQATAAAIDAVRKTQFNYSAVNKARFMSRSTSELLRPVMLFQQYAQHVYYLMLRSAIDGFSAAKTPQERKEARKTFYRILGAHTIAAGTLGGMFEPIRAAAGMAFALAQMVGLADEDDDFESWWQRGANSAFGDMGGQIFSKGLPYGALGIDLHGRLGLNNLVSMSDPRVKGMEGSEWLMHKMFGLLGPLGSTAASMADMPQKMRRGDYTGAIASASPKAIRDLMQAHRYGDTGILDYTGNVIMQPDQIDGLSLAFKVVGFAPSPVSQMYSSRGAIKRVETRIRKKRTRLMERWRRADTPAAQKNVLNDMYEFNKNYPEFMIDGKARVQAKARKRENEQQAAQQRGFFSSANPAQQRRLQQYGAF